MSASISITRDIALYALAVHSMRGFDLSSALGSQVLRMPESARLLFSFHFVGKTLRRSVEAAVVFSDTECPETCAFRRVTECVSAAQGIGWDLNESHFLPVVAPDGTRGKVALSAPRMTCHVAVAPACSEAAGPLHNALVSGGGSLLKSSAGTAVDEIMKIGGWKTEQPARYHIGATTSVPARATGRMRDGPSKRERESDYETATDVPHSLAFEEDFASCTRR